MVLASVLLTKMKWIGVVNANILRALAIFGEKQAPGYQDACKLLNRMGIQKKFDNCGLYYPDTYWYHYTVARAYRDGADCLAEGVEASLDHLLSQQSHDGRWENHVIQGDDIQATALALGALVMASDPSDPAPKAAFQKGLRFLLTQMKQKTPSETYWEGGVFFFSSSPA